MIVLLVVGGIPNAIFATDNTDTYNRLKPCSMESAPARDFCVDIKWLRDSEIAAAVSYYLCKNCYKNLPVNIHDRPEMTASGATALRWSV